MKPTEILAAEHRVIEQVLDCLEAIAEKGRAEGRLDADSARKALDFFRTFADRCHHGKEEVHLFPAMDAKGFPRDGGPTGVMLAEHERGRAAIRGMAERVEAAGRGDLEAVEGFASLATAYVNLLRQHIEKEDHCLFPMADQAFSAEDQRTLEEAFAHVERHDMGEGTHENYLATAAELATLYGVERRTSVEGHGACGCGHKAHG